jgi:hypothetical protein
MAMELGAREHVQLKVRVLSGHLGVIGLYFGMKYCNAKTFGGVRGGTIYCTKRDEASSVYKN